MLSVSQGYDIDYVDLIYDRKIVLDFENYTHVDFNYIIESLSIPLFIIA